MREVAATEGLEDSTYHSALTHIRRQSREHGIDAALQHSNEEGALRELDGLLFCDRKGVGQQLAAQAGKIRASAS